MFELLFAGVASDPRRRVETGGSSTFNAGGDPMLWETGELTGDETVMATTSVSVVARDPRRAEDVTGEPGAAEPDEEEEEEEEDRLEELLDDEAVSIDSVVPFAGALVLFVATLLS